jgi:N-acetylneuraminate synthase
MSGDLDFRDLFILDMANNHQGDVDHGLNIIRKHAAVIRKHGVRAAMKFQFRQLDAFVHPTHRKGSDNKHIPRFLSTRLNRHQFETLFEEVKKQNLIALCTPFDEESVDLIVDMGFDGIKVASCSANDWPLLDKIADSGKPIICSTGGLVMEQVDKVVSFFEHRAVDFAIMHCVSIYPTPDDLCNLSNIAMMRERYPNRVIGWSTHEDPADTVPVQVAIAKGAEIYERHVGLNTDSYKLNAYSSTPEQVDAWVAASRKAIALCGSYRRQEPPPVEAESIDSLRRGVFARKPVKKGTVLDRREVYFAMPYTEDQLSSGQWKEGIKALADIKRDAPVMTRSVEIPPPSGVQVIKSAIHDVKGLLNEAHVPLNTEFRVEYSHHLGMEKFRQTGAVIVNCINREYCKKIIVQLAGQKHPAHYHKLKEETFQVLHGTLNISVEGHIHTLHPGDTCLIQPGVWHSFWTDTGCVFEEVSTTHYDDDSYYKDKAINRMARDERKTVVDHWGRFQMMDETKESAKA